MPEVMVEPHPIPAVLLTHVHNHVETMSEGCYDRIIGVEHIHFTNIEEVDITGGVGGDPESFIITPHAQRQVCARLGIPHTYLEKCPGQLQYYNLSYWLTQERNDTLFFRFRNMAVRALFTPRYVPVDNLPVVEALRELGIGDDYPCSYRIDDGIMVLSILDDPFELNGRDYRHGVTIVNSEIGISSLKVHSFIYDVARGAGIVIKVSGAFGKRHVIEGLLDALPIMIESARDQRDQNKLMMEISRNSRIVEPDEWIETIVTRYRLGEDEIAYVEKAREGREFRTMYDVVELFMDASIIPGIGVQAHHHLELVAGELLQAV